MAKHVLGDNEPHGASADSNASDAAQNGFDPASLHFITRGVSSAERAAVISVLGGVLEQESAMLGAAPGRGASAWQASQRVLRTPIEPGHGRWNRPIL